MKGRGIGGAVGALMGALLFANPLGIAVLAGIGAFSGAAVVPSAEAAIAEVDRLNRLNGAKGARYYWMTTRY